MKTPTLHWFTFLCTSLLTAGLLYLNPGAEHTAEQYENLLRLSAGTSLGFAALSLILQGSWTQRGVIGAAGVCAGNAIDVALEAMKAG